MTSLLIAPPSEPLTTFRKLLDHTENTAISSSSDPTTSSSTSSTNPDFRELLAVMMMGMAMQGGSGDDSGFSFGGMMAPFMMTLMEQLMSQEVSGGTTAEVHTPQLVPQGLPVEGRFTQYYHAEHHGVDIAIPTGTPIQSTMDGKVVYAGWNNEGYGNLVIVENGPYRTYYAHLSEIPVEVGQTVTAGDVIGLSGSTGNSTGPHLHYEVRYNGQPMNPQEFF